MTTPARDYLAAIDEAIRPDARVYADEWAEQNRILPADTPEPGPIRVGARTPYLVDIHRTMSPASPYVEGWWIKPHQVGGSVTGEDLIGTWICGAAGSILVVFPTLDDARQWEAARFEPMRLGTKALRRRVRESGEKGAGNTKLRKRFPGGVMRLVGANRVGALKSSTIRYIKFEEPDEYAADIGEQGGPVDLARMRAANFGRRAKIYGDGTPTIDGASLVQREAARGDCRRWHLFCPEPDCRFPQVLQFELDRVKWDEGDPDSVRYACEKCGALNDEVRWKAENYRPRPSGMSEAEAEASGRAFWKASAVGEPGVASWIDFEALAAPIPWRPWPSIVREHLAAQGNPEKLRLFTNNYRGRAYKELMSAEIPAAELMRRCSSSWQLMTAPRGALICTAGVDTQDNRLAVVIRAWGRDEESWGVWHSEIPGDTSLPEVWGRLADLLRAPIKHASGQVMRIDAAAIDMGGHRTEEVKAFCREAQLRGRHWFAVAGAKPYDAPPLSKPRQVEFTWQGRPVPGGSRIWFVGTQSIKSLLDGRLKLTGEGGGRIHWPAGFGLDYFEQLRAERRRWLRDARGNRVLVWVNPSGARNEAWDCEVYCYAAFRYAMTGTHAETVWRSREKLFSGQLELVQTSATEETPAASATTEIEIQAPAPAPDPPRWRRRGGFVRGWRR